MSKRLLDGKNYIKGLIQEKGIYRPKSNRFMFGKSYGTRYSSQFYLSNCYYDALFMDAVVDWFIYYYRNDLHDIQLCGREWSALPLIGALQMGVYHKTSYRLNAFHVRKERKRYGKHNMIEGTPNNKLVLAVDDLCNSTDGLRMCYIMSKHIGLTPHKTQFAILNKYSRKIFGSEMEYDRYSGQKCLSIVERDELKWTV